MAAGDTWAADVEVSKPEALGDLPPMVEFDGGFCFTTGGMAHLLSQADAEEFFSPTYSPDRVV